MIPQEILKKIRKIHFKTSRKVNTLMAGQYKSIFRGSGIEFEEVREYTPGDDVKSIDWKVSARLGRPFIKRYREERELRVILLLDLSASGRFGTGQQLKRDTAAEIAAMLAFNAIRNNDKVGAILFTDTIEKYIPPQKGSAHVWRLIKEIYTFRPDRTGTDIGGALAYLGRVCRKRALGFVISDFLDRDYLKALKTIAQKHEIIGILLSDPGDFHLPEGGIVSLTDLETQEQILVDAADKRVREAYTRIKETEYQASLSTLKSADVDVMDVRTTDSVGDVLSRYFRYREKRKG